MAAVAKEGPKMRAEIKHILRTPLYWLVLIAGIGARTVFAYLDFKHRLSSYWTLSDEYWSRLGSITVAFLILLVLIHRFSVDYENNTYSVIASTAYGRKKLYFERLAAGCLMAILGVVILTIANIGITLTIGRSSITPTDWLYGFASHTIVVIVGAVGYFLVSAFVCDAISNHPASMCICGLPLGISYFINIGIIEEFDLFWFIRYGFFTELIRGRWISSLPAFWGIWYPVMIVGVFILSIYRRKERKLL